MGRLHTVRGVYNGRWQVTLDGIRLRLECGEFSKLFVANFPLLICSLFLEIIQFYPPPHTWAHPFTIKTCISLIRQNLPGSERSAPLLTQDFNLLVIRNVFILVEVVQRHSRFDQMPLRHWFIEGHAERELTAA